MEVNYEKVFSNSGLNGFAHRPICPISRVDDLNRKFASFKLCGKRCLGWSFRGDRERNSEKGRLSGANPGLSLGKSLQNGSGRRKCYIVWDDVYQSTRR